MTTTVNGIGTALCGQRRLTDEELKQWSKHFPYIPHVDMRNFQIATEAFVFIFIPIIPLKTFVFYYTESGFMNSKYRILYYPAGEDRVYWPHVKTSFSFYILPALIVLGILAYFFF